MNLLKIKEKGREISNQDSTFITEKLILEIVAYICKWDNYTELKNCRLAYSVMQKLRNLRSGENFAF